MGRFGGRFFLLGLLSFTLTKSPDLGAVSVEQWGRFEASFINDGTYADPYRDVTLSGGSTLAVSGPVKIVVNGRLNGSGGSFYNPSHVPANLQIASSYAAANGVTLSGGAGAYMSVYAPTTGVTLSGNAPIYGAVLGKTLTASGNAAVHYDTQLLTVWASYFNP